MNGVQMPAGVQMPLVGHNAGWLTHAKVTFHFLKHCLALVQAGAAVQSHTHKCMTFCGKCVTWTGVTERKREITLLGVITAEL